MRVLHVIPYMSPVFGGPPEVVKAMVRASLSHGHEVIVLSTSIGLNGNAGGEVNLSSFDGKTYRLFLISFFGWWFYSRNLNNELKKLSSSIDLVHLHIPFTGPFYFAAKWAIKNNIPYVISAHGMLDNWSMNHKKFKKWLYYNLIERKTLKKALKLHVTSLLEKDEVERLGLSVPLEVICLPVFFGSEESELKLQDKSNFIDDEVPHILFIGRLHHVKGIPYLLKALATLRQRGKILKLDLAGAGDPKYEQQIQELIKENGLDSWVILHQHVNGAQKDILYKKASVFVLPSLHENFGLAAAEAMLAGLPVVVTDRVGLAADVSKFEAGIVIPACDSDSLANAIDKIISAKSLKMAKSAKELAKNEYGFKIFSERLNDFYSIKSYAE